MDAITAAMNIPGRIIPLSFFKEAPMKVVVVSQTSHICDKY